MNQQSNRHQDSILESPKGNRGSERYTTNIALAAVTFFGVTLWSGTVSGADFDCQKARTKVEQLICPTPELSAMDEDMNFLYRHLALRPNDNRERVAQRQWLRRRNACGTDAVCLRMVYMNRISHLLGKPTLKLPETDAALLGGTSVRLRSGWVIDENEEPAISPCPELRDYMNKEGAYWWRSDNGYNTYCTGAAEKSPLFESVPWKSLAPEVHNKLLVELLRQRDEGARAYFLGEHRHTDDYYQEQAKQFVSTGGTLEYWSGHLFDSFVDVYPSAYLFTHDQIQHVVQLSTPVWRSSEDRSFPGCGLSTRKVALFLVTAELTGPAPVSAPSLEYATLKLYRGHPVLITTGGAALDFFFPVGESALYTCKLRFIKDVAS